MGRLYCFAFFSSCLRSGREGFLGFCVCCVVVLFQCRER